MNTAVCGTGSKHSGYSSDHKGVGHTVHFFSCSESVTASGWPKALISVGVSGTSAMHLVSLTGEMMGRFVFLPFSGVYHKRRQG